MNSDISLLPAYWKTQAKNKWLSTIRELGRVKDVSEPVQGFMFSGQGSQRQLMGHWLYEHNADFSDGGLPWAESLREA